MSCLVLVWMWPRGLITFLSQYGASEAFHATCADLHKSITVICDGQEVDLPHLEGIAVLNIPRWEPGPMDPGQFSGQCGTRLITTAPLQHVWWNKPVGREAIKALRTAAHWRRAH